MAINYPQFPKLNAADLGGLGGFDLGEAIRSGLSNYQKYYQAKYEPRNLENRAISAEQTNQINAPYAQNAERVFNADIGTKEANLKRILQEMFYKKQQKEQDQFLNNLISGNSSRNAPGHMTSHGFEGSLNGEMGEDNYSNTGEDREAEQQAIERLNRPGSMWSSKDNDFSIAKTPNLSEKITNGIKNNSSIKEQLLSQGNPSLNQIDSIYDNYPQYRKQLEAKGFKKTQTVKYDPKSGIASVITTYPSGKTTIKATVEAGKGENSPATTAIKTANQKTINSIKNSRPIIEKLISDTKEGNVPGQWLGHYFHPDLQAAYYSDVIQSADTLAGAFGYPNTEGGLNAAKETVLRKPRESDSGYINRLKSLLKDMAHREETAQQVLNKGINTHGKKSNNLTSHNDPLGIR